MTRAKDISKIVTDADLSGTLDVTGDLTVDTNTLKVDSTNNRVGIGDDTPDALLSIKGNSDSATTPSIRLKDGTDTREAWITNSAGDLFLVAGRNDNVPRTEIRLFDGNLITFKTDNTERMRITSDGKIGLSSSTVSVDSQVAIGGGNLELTTAGAKYWIPRASDGVLTGSLYSPSGSAIRLSGAGTGTGSLEFEPSSSSGVALTINSNGKVGIGGSPSTPLHVQASGQNANIRLQASDNGYASQLQLYANNVSGASYNAIQSHVNGDGTVQWEISGAKASAEDQMLFSTGGSERMRISSGGQLSLATTDTTHGFNVGQSGTDFRGRFQGSNQYRLALQNGTNDVVWLGSGGANDFRISNSAGSTLFNIVDGGNVLIGTSNQSPAEGTTTGTRIGDNGGCQFSASNGATMRVNRVEDGTIINFASAGASEGIITVSGTTVSYNGGHLARWSRLLDNSKDTSIVKGTVMTNLDEMVEWGDEDNEQLNKMAVSSVEGDANVAGVFVNWDNDDDWNDMNIAMTGDMVIRIAQGTTVARGDLLMSAGDGTAKPQGDDIVRSKTIAKVTSTNLSHTYDDGTYLVPCVLMAC